MNKNFLFGLASLIGTIIGAGVFGVPYVMSKSGVLPCLFYFILLSTLVLFLHLAFSEIVLRTKGNHRLIGYAEKYLGDKAKILIGVSVLFGTLGSLLAYIILAGKFANLIFPLSSFQWSFYLWALLSLLVLFGIKSIAKAEFYMNIGLFFVIFLVFGLSLPKIQASNLVLISKDSLFLPFGVILFSLIGLSAIPEVAGILKKKSDLKKIIITTSITVTLLFFLFGLIITGVTGQDTTQDALTGLQAVFGTSIIVLGGIFGLLAVATSFLILSNYLKNTLRFDYNVPHFFSFSLAVFLPMFFFLIGFREFIQVIGIVGVFIGLIEGTAIFLIFKKAKKEGDKVPAYNIKVPNVLIYIAISILILGALFQLIYG